MTVRLSLIVCASLLALAACRSGDSRESSDWRAAIERWTHTQPIPDLELIDHRGQPFRLSSLARDYVLLGFIFTRCPVAQACPMTVEKMRAAHQRVQARGAEGIPRLRLLALTLDPAYDTPERLRAYASARSLDLEHWTLATGPEELMQSGLPSLFNVLALPRGDGDIEHTVKIALLAPGLRVVKEWKDNQFSAQDVLRAIARLESGSNAPDSRADGPN